MFFLKITFKLKL